MPRARLVIALAALLAGCGGNERADNLSQTNVSQNDVLETSSDTANAPTPSEPTGSDQSHRAESNAAAKTLHHYYTLIVAGDYGQAFRLWDGDGAASGMTQRQFADRLGKFAAYRADIGEPGDVQTTADGDHEVDIPVTVTGSTPDGSTFRKEGRATMRLASSQNGGASSAGSWHIASIDFARAPPGPSASTAGGRPIVRKLACIDGSSFTARFDPESKSVTLSQGGKRIATLDSQRPAEGIYYRSGNYVMRGKDDRVAISLPDRAPLPCRVS